ncbi:hypothetical protein DUNSADRAFT_3133 [Dunaliella salina]|uniref:Uncharacterized protein n=1 Tax=Dunaliella salina TaxID=3046 RepID=A0ABQ7H819_DUNSA|nr:hypothetical protein DUNSADRAFT_3133 [Dunaliella salina]|eukprot:KAF5843004.1 hypothetical protein DUNSADRAFT_3133 [Dunaliella salina]
MPTSNANTKCQRPASSANTKYQHPELQCQHQVPASSIQCQHQVPAFGAKLAAAPQPKAVFEEYQKKDDFDSIKFIESAVDDIHQTCAQQQGAIKDVIKSMSQEASGLEASSRYPQAEGSHARRMAALQADIKDIQDSIREMQENER